MQTDLYTKIILTIIAICLVWMVVSPIAITPVQAGSKDIINVNIEQVDGRNIYKALPVKVQNK